MSSRAISGQVIHATHTADLLHRAGHYLQCGLPTLGLAACLGLLVCSFCAAGAAQAGDGVSQVPALQNQGGPSGSAAQGGSNTPPATHSDDSAGLLGTPPGLDTAAWDAASSQQEDRQEDSKGDIPRYLEHPGCPASQFQFDYYQDSAHNSIFTLTSLTNVSVGGATFTLRREKVSARGPQGEEGSEATVVSGYGKPWKWLLVGGGIGVIGTEDGSSSLAGSLTSSVTMGSMSITLGAARGLLEANAQTIRNHVMQNDLNLSIWKDVTEQLGADVEFHHRIFSDGNDENDFALVPQYWIKIGKTNLVLDWSFEYADFAQPTTLGYYAPQGLLSNQPAVSWKFDHAGYYGLLKVGVGRMFHLYQSQWMPSFAGTGVAAFGRRLSERSAVEWYLTAGRDSLGIPSAWNSMNTGFKLNYSF
jgi:hypothetical protein